MFTSITVSRPEGDAQQLMLLFNGVGSDAQDMVALGEQLAAAFPGAFIVSVQAPERFEFGPGYQWFSVNAVTEANRVERVARALPAFVAAIQHWQHVAHVGIERTTLIGFSQGAIMALESARARPCVAGRVVSIAGRFAQLPDTAPKETTVHLFHGQRDAVIPSALTVDACARLAALGAKVTADVVPDLGHGINATLLTVLIERLQNPLS
jgi:phospholipase/carboxylesterase